MFFRSKKAKADDVLQSGSPISNSNPNSRLDDSTPNSVKSQRKSSEMQYFGNFGFRIVKDRPSITETPSISPTEISPDLPKTQLSQFSQNVSSSTDEDEIILADFEMTPEKPKSAEQPQTPPTQWQNQSFGPLVKSAAVSALGRLSTQQQTKQLCNNIYASFFQVFDEWNRQNEKKKKIKKPEIKEPVVDQLPIAQEKLDLISHEEEKWRDFAEKSQKEIEDMSNSTVVPSQSVLHIDNNYDYILTKELITQLDPLCVKIQTDYSHTKQIERDADDFAAILGDVSKPSANVDALLCH